ncbi:MAG: DUF1573 domain-containing protein [Acidobacteriota bacterium]
MSDFPTGGSPSAGEAQALRARYIRHRDALARLAADAPTPQLADAYNRVHAEVEGSIARLDQLAAGVTPTAPGTTASVPFLERIPTAESAAPVHPARLGNDTGPYNSPFDGTYEPLPEVPASQTGARVVVLALVGVLVLALIGYFVWRYSAAGGAHPQIVEETAATTTANVPPPDGSSTAASTTAVPATVADALSVTPPSFDYGVVRKGTRKTQKFSIQSNSNDAVPIKIGRSQCRCLWFEHPAAVPAHGKATLTVTVDGGRAKAGQLNETVQLQMKDKSAAGHLDVTATVK